MNKYFQGSVIPFLKTYWWIWLIISMLTIIVMVIGASVVGSFIYNIFRFICWVAVAIFLVWGLYYYFWGKGVIGMWSILRIIGLGGVILFTWISVSILDKNKLHDLLWNPNLATLKLHFIISIALIIIFLFFIGMGEMLLYLHKINFKLKQQLDAKKSDDI